METYTQEEVVKRSTEMLDNALSRPSIKLEGNAENMRQIFRGMFSANENNDKQSRGK